jgi:acetyl-CoA synthetase
MLMYFTSGTTGYPKMSLHTQKYGVSHLITAKHWQRLTGGSLHFTVSESGWAKFTWGKMYGQFLCAATVFVFDFDKFNPNAILEKVERYKITSLCAPPTMFRMMLLADIGKYDLSSLQYCTIAGEALSPEVFNSWYRHTGVRLMEGFGQTETVVVCANLPGMTPKPGSMGKPVPLYDVDIVDAGGNTLPDGETGEIVIRSGGDMSDMYGLFKEYYKNEEATKSARRGGMYFTGDTAFRDEDGYFWYVGRKDDLIKSSGYRIGPFEIESVLLEHPAVLEAAVTGVKDEIRGQVVKATIVLRAEYKGKADVPEERARLVKDIQEHVKATTAPYKYPRVIEFIDELPKTVSGKIRRVALRERDA